MSGTSSPARPAAWPDGLLLEELRLRSRRRLVGELVRRGVWPDRATFRRFAAEQRIAGERLRDGPVRAAVGEEAFAILRSPAAFGGANRRMAARLPSILAFGYELGAGLCGGDEAAAERAGTCCAVFNVGVAMFDFACDTLPGAAARLGELVDERRLRELGGGGSVNAVPETDEPELRLLLAIVAAFFALAPPGAALAELLERAYRAEMRSVGGERLPREEAVAVARSKSTLPFTVIGAVAGAEEHPAVEDVGVAFWLIDDVVDVVADYRTGALNALLAEACGGFAPDGYAPKGLAALLDDGALDEAAREVGARLERAVEALGGGRSGGGESAPPASARLAEVVRCNARDWIR